MGDDVAADVEDPGGVDGGYGAGVEAAGFNDLAGEDPLGGLLFLGSGLGAGVFSFAGFLVAGLADEEGGTGEDEGLPVGGAAVEVGLFASADVGEEAGEEAGVDGFISSAGALDGEG